MSVSVRNTSRKQPTNDYLKYWRVIKYWAKRKYNISTEDLEMMLFIYSEHLFNKTKFKQRRKNRIRKNYKWWLLF